MSDLKGSIVVTGANGGLGSAIASRIASTSLGKEYYGVYTVRNPDSAESLKSAVSRKSVHKHDTIALDLASLASVRECAAAINSRVAAGSLPPIRALILNAAFQDGPGLTMSKDGFDMSFQVNYLSHFLLTLLLLQSMDKEHGRILVIGSWSHDPSDPRNESGTAAGAFSEKWQTIFTDTESLARGKWSPPEEGVPFHPAYRRYGASKLCEIMFMYELQSRLQQDKSLSNISVVGLDPGAMATGIMRNGSWLNRTLIMKVALPIVAPIATRFQANPLVRTTSKSAEDALRACFDTDTLGARPRALYLDGTVESKTSAESKDEGKRARLWKDSTGYAQLRDGDTVLQHWM